MTPKRCEVLGCQGYTGISDIWLVVATLVQSPWSSVAEVWIETGSHLDSQTCDMERFGATKHADSLLQSRLPDCFWWRKDATYNHEKKTSRHAHLVVCWESLFLRHLLVLESSQENKEHLPESWWQNQAASSLHSWWHGRELLSFIDFHWDRSPKIRVSPQWRCVVSIQNRSHLWWFQDQ